MFSEGEPGGALITCGRWRRVMRPGDSLTFGRGLGHDLRIGHAPEDLRIPRNAGHLECRLDGVLIHNTSDKRTLGARTFPGPGFVVQPGALVGTVPHEMVQLVLSGQAGGQYAINIDTRALTTATGSAPSEDSLPTIGFARIDGLRPRQRHLLLALCLPVWSGQGTPGAVPSYVEMVQIFRDRGVGVSAGRLRKDLDALRRELWEEHGVEGVHADDRDEGVSGGKQTFLPTLAQWARLSGNVTEGELERFNDGDLSR